MAINITLQIAQQLEPHCWGHDSHVYIDENQNLLLDKNAIGPYIWRDVSRGEEGVDWRWLTGCSEFRVDITRRIQAAGLTCLPPLSPLYYF